MTSQACATLSPKGQVTIPLRLRRRLKLQPGARLAVLADRGAIVLRPLRRPSLGEFNRRISELRQAARKAGLHRADVARAIREARGKC